MMSYTDSRYVSYMCPFKQVLCQTGRICNVLQSLAPCFFYIHGQEQKKAKVPDSVIDCITQTAFIP